MIDGLENDPLPGFARGRVTVAANGTFPPDSLEKAKNIVLMDSGIQRIKGYRKIGAANAKPIERMFSWQRQTDGSQFTIITQDGKIVLCDGDGNKIADLKIGEASNDGSFVQGTHSAYYSNSANAYTLYDSGNEGSAIRKMGMLAPTFIPTLTVLIGGLTLTYGRRYVVCEVVYWTDSTGTQRYHIGAPSDFSAHTGPQAAKAIQVNLGAAVNPATTHFWIFATPDSEIDTSATYDFAAEVVVGTTAWADTLTDDQLDGSRPAPFDNFAPTASQVMVDYEGRIAFLSGDTVQMTGLDEITLGVPYETAPASLRFKVPSGVKKLVGGASFQQTLMLATQDFWFQVRGSSVADFQKRDNIFGPGLAGYKLTLVTPTHLLWVSPDKVLNSWNGSSIPTPVSPDLMQPGNSPDSLSMKDISDAQLADGELMILQGESYKFVVLMVSSVGTKVKNWIQLWDVTQFMKGQVNAFTSIASVPMTDMIPAHNLWTATPVKRNGQSYIYFGAQDGTVYRWPDGDTFDGKPIIALAESPPMPLSFFGTKQMYYMDVYTNRAVARELFALFAGGSDGTQRVIKMVQIDPNEEGQTDDTMIRFQLNQDQATALVKFFKWRIVFPDDEAYTVIDAITIAHRPKPGIRR